MNATQLIAIRHALMLALASLGELDSCGDAAADRRQGAAWEAVKNALAQLKQEVAL